MILDDQESIPLHHPLITEHARAQAHQAADAVAKDLRVRGCIVEVTSDENGLPVITYTAPPAVQSITMNITLSREQ